MRLWPWPRRHRHYPAQVQVRGVYSYATCRCGARRTRRVSDKGYSAIPLDWPRPREGWREWGL